MPERVRGTLLRVFVDESDRFEGKPLYMAIVERLKADGFVGATVLKGIEGYGLHGIVHSARAVDFAENLPILIEVIETEEKISAFIPTLKEMISEGLVTLEKLDFMRIGTTLRQ